MNIGIDAKRAYHNGTGLGVFNRVLIELLAEHFPQHEYFLFNPKPGKLFIPRSASINEILPQKKIHQLLRSAWRSKWVIQDLKKLKIDLYHGTSQEIPMGLAKTGIRSVVTIHDLFPVLYPKDFKPIDVRIYRSKLRHACTHASRIMAISRETKRHIENHYQIDPDKIDVAYQSCDPAFSILQSDEKKAAVRKLYNLPAQFFLHVGTIIERKNLLNICKAMQLVQKQIDIPLVVVGKGGAYKERVKQYIAEQNLQNKIIFLSENLEAAGKKSIFSQLARPLHTPPNTLLFPSRYSRPLPAPANGVCGPVLDLASAFSKSSGRPICAIISSTSASVICGAPFFNFSFISSAKRASISAIISSRPSSLLKY